MTRLLPVLLGGTLVLCCNNPAPSPPPSTAPAPVVASPWVLTVVGPVYGWPEPDGRFFVVLHWQLRHEGPDAPEYLAGADQTLRLRSSAGYLSHATFPGTLVLEGGSSAVTEAMFYSQSTAVEPTDLELEGEFRRQLVARLPVQAIRVATTGLRLSLGSAAAKAGVYAGHRQEPVVSTLSFEVRVDNPTGSPVRFSPFDLAGESGGELYRSHHLGSHDRLMLVPAHGSELVKHVVAAHDTTPPGADVIVRYGAETLGTLPVTR